MRKTILLLLFTVSLSSIWAQTKNQPAASKAATKNTTVVKKKIQPRKKSNDALKNEIKKIEADKSLTCQQKKQRIRSVVQQQKSSRAKQQKNGGKP